MNINKKIIFYISLIIVILILVFLSQQAYSRAWGKSLVSAATNQISTYLAKGTSSVITSAHSKLNDQIQGGGATIQNQIDQTKQKISDAEKNISNYFSGIANSIAGKSNNSCATSK